MTVRVTEAKDPDFSPGLDSVTGKGRWLRALRNTWPRTVCRLLEDGESAVVRVAIAEVRGSAPREPGTSMLVTHHGTYGTIGGGNLEWHAMRAAQSLLKDRRQTRSVQIRRLVLGRELAQCCGGVVQLWLERFTRDDLPLLQRAAQESDTSVMLTEVTKEGVIRRLLQRDASQTYPRFSSVSDERATLLEPLQTERAALWVYGAGHVAQALIHIVAHLPFTVTWIDSRAELLPAPLPDDVHALCTQTPVTTINSAPAGARFLVMTHDHALDYALCRRILERHDFTWLGLIGSKSKGARFRSRLARDGVAPETIARLTCPIGIQGIDSKLPAAIAVAVAAQLLQVLGPTEGRSAPAPSPALCTAPDCASCSAGRRWPGKLDPS